jgi:hypothetical protein
VSWHDDDGVAWYLANLTLQVYVGDSASLSYLQLIRMIVENSSGTSAFTTDPRRHQILEAADSLPVGTPVPRIVPDRETASVLIESYFTNVGISDSKMRGDTDQCRRHVV